MAEKLHQYTGLPTAYWVKADLRVNGGSSSTSCWARAATSPAAWIPVSPGPSMDPMGKEAEYDPQSAAISSAYVATFNDYVRKTLHFGQDMHYRLFAGFHHWDFRTAAGRTTASSRPT